MISACMAGLCGWLAVLLTDLYRRTLRAQQQTAPARLDWIALTGDAVAFLALAAAAGSPRAYVRSTIR